MKYIKDIIISTKEPPVNNIAWLQPQSNNTYKLFIYGNNGWMPLSHTSDNNIQIIKEIPDITIDN